MSLISGLTGILGILGGAQGSNQGRGLSNRGYGYQDQAVQNAGQSYRNALQWLNNRQAQGAYNAQEALKLASDMASQALKTTDRNTAAQLSTLGYKRGDSPFTQKANQNSEAANFKLRSDLLGIQDAYDQNYLRDMGAVNNIGSQYNNLLSGIGGSYVNQGAQQQQNAYSGLSGLIGSGIFDKKGAFDWLKIK